MTGKVVSLLDVELPDADPETEEDVATGGDSTGVLDENAAGGCTVEE